MPPPARQQLLLEQIHEAVEGGQAGNADLMANSAEHDKREIGRAKRTAAAPSTTNIKSSTHTCTTTEGSLHNTTWFSYQGKKDSYFFTR